MVLLRDKALAIELVFFRGEVHQMGRLRLNTGVFILILQGNEDYLQI
jgi:hypothetical protein